MISVVMLNWRRPEQVRVNAVRCAGYKLVSEVIVFTNAGPPLDLSLCPRPATQITANYDLGLYSRFAAATLAANECILHLDDDLMVPEDTLKRLYRSWRGDRAICHSLHGRQTARGYQLEEAFGKVEVVLTRCLMASRQLCAHALTHAHQFDDLKSERYGNGEDIILSFTAMKLSGRLNCAYKLPFTEFPATGAGGRGGPAVAIHRRWSGHQAHRARVLERCREHFGIKAGALR